MIVRNAFIFVIGVLVVAGGALAMSAGAKIVNNSDIQLSCRVTRPAPRLPPGFEAEFCGALEIYLADELAVGFRLVSGGAWIKDGRAVQVDIRLRSENGAGVTITSGRVIDGSFADETSAEMSLYSSDAPLASSSSKALVRGIGIQLGLLR